jgi:hypothetical protein
MYFDLVAFPKFERSDHGGRKADGKTVSPFGDPQCLVSSLDLYDGKSGSRRTQFMDVRPDSTSNLRTTLPRRLAQITYAANSEQQA